MSCRKQSIDYLFRLAIIFFLVSSIKRFEEDLTEYKLKMPQMVAILSA